MQARGPGPEPRSEVVWAAGAGHPTCFPWAGTGWCSAMPLCGRDAGIRRWGAFWTRALRVWTIEDSADLLPGGSSAFLSQTK